MICYCNGGSQQKCHFSILFFSANTCCRHLYAIFLLNPTTLSEFIQQGFQLNRWHYFVTENLEC